MASNRCCPPAADVPRQGSRAAVTARDNTWELGTGATKPMPSWFCRMGLAGRQGLPRRGGSPTLLLPADRAVLPRKVRVAKIERGHGMAGGQEAPDPSGTERGHGTSQGTLFFGDLSPGGWCVPGGGERGLTGAGRGVFFLAAGLSRRCREPLRAEPPSSAAGCCSSPGDRG